VPWGLAIPERSKIRSRVIRYTVVSVTIMPFSLPLMEDMEHDVLKRVSVERHLPAEDPPEVEHMPSADFER
jgi:hypothetical protein